MATVAQHKAPPQEGPPAPAEPLFEPAMLLARVGGDAGFLCELLGLFLQEAQQRLEQVRQAVTHGDAARLRQSAHGLRGLVGQFSTGTAFRAATRLEHLGRDGELADTVGALADLDEALAVLQPALAAFATELASRGSANC